MKQKLLSLLLSLSLLTGLSAPALAAETASVIRLTKTTGTVEISKSSGKSVSLLTNMRLYNGYHVETSEESYAWINLDDSKLLKEDAESEVEVRKDGKSLEVLTVSGNVFFDVAKPLEDDESMNIRTSTTAVGIRGTSGWIKVLDRWTTRVSVLEGVVECSVADPVTGQLKSEEIHGGETALCVVYPQEKTGDKSDILREKFAVEDIPGFVLTDVVRDIPLCDKIKENTGVDILEELAKDAGGDPGGRTPEGDSATREVLGEADRREDADEDKLHEKLEEIEKEQEKQPENVSPGKPIEKPSTPAPSARDDSSDSGGGNDSGTGAPAPTPPQAPGMKLKDAEVQALLDAGSSVTIEPNSDAADMTPKKNTLEVDTGLSVASGKTLDLQSGIDVEVYPGKTLQVDGTLTADALTNNGTTVVTSGNTLRLRDNLTTSGTLTVTATGRVVVDGAFTRTGTLSLTTGATVLAKTFAPGAAPEGWEVSATADASGYYSLTPAEAPPTPPTPPEPPVVTYAVKFNANGGKWGENTEQTVVQTNPDGTITWPAAPVKEGLAFAGWHTAADGGELVPSSKVFNTAAELFAHWDDWYYDPETATLTIGGNVGEIPDLSGSPWTDRADTITDVVILDGVTGIGEHAFSGCNSLANVTISDSVTSIGSGAFEGCSGLTGITIPDSVTDIGDHAFCECIGLTSLTIPSSVVSIGHTAFSNCRGLTSLEILPGITHIETHVFSRCIKLKSVRIPSSVTSIEKDAFRDCSGLTSITVDGENLYYSSDGVALFNKDQTVLVKFPEGYRGTYDIPDSVTSIEGGGIGYLGAFGGCSGLTRVTIPSGVTSIGNYTFDGCSSLESVTIPASVTSIGNSAFYGCSGLTTINFTGTESQWRGITKKNGAIPSNVTAVVLGDGTSINPLP